MKRTTGLFHGRGCSATCLLLAAFMLSACGSASLPESPPEGRHITLPEQPSEEAGAEEEIPEVVETVPLLPEPGAEEVAELYSVVALDVPVRELLFAIARDASINIDIHPDVSGEVSLNAIDQSIPQILERLARQIDIRWRLDTNGNLLVEPDTPYWEIYTVDYVNVARSASTSTDVSTSIVRAVGGANTGASNNSNATLNQNSTNNFWESLANSISGLLAGSPGEAGEAPPAGSVVSNPESGIINVLADSDQHGQIRTFLNFVQTRSLNQVLIEATVVEVTLSDSYQSGVDWQAVIASSAGNIRINQSVTGANLNSPPTNVLTIEDNDSDFDILATVRLLSRFGDLRVLSSPKIMALNNQPAMLRVVDNRVYFTIEVEPAVVTNAGLSPATYTSTPQTVPVGFVMTVTPQISDNDQVTLNVRPTISRIVRFVNDPNPVLAQEGVLNQIPEIQIREIESILKVYSGEIAILGGLMQDSLESDTAGLPGISRIPVLGDLFSYRDDSTSKTELIVFIRPVVIRQPSVQGDLEQYRQFLPEAGEGADSL